MSAIEYAVESALIAALDAGDARLDGRGVHGVDEDEAAGDRIVVEVVEDTQELGGWRPRGLTATITIHSDSSDGLDDDRAAVLEALDNHITDPTGVFGYLRSHHDEVIKTDQFLEGKGHKRWALEMQFEIWAKLASVAPEIVSGVTPANLATNVAVSGTTIEWTPSGGATGYVVKFGTQTPPTDVSVSTAHTHYNPGTLAKNTRYYVRIDAVNAVGTTTGAVTSFLTVAATSAGKVTAANLSIANGATGIDCLSASVYWPPATDATGYDVRLGVSGSTPPIVSENQAGVTYALGTLIGGTVYALRIDSRVGDVVTPGDQITFTAFQPSDITRVTLTHWHRVDGPANPLIKSEGPTVYCTTEGDECLKWSGTGGNFARTGAAGTGFVLALTRGNAGAVTRAALVSDGSNDSMTADFGTALNTQFLVIGSQTAGNLAASPSYHAAYISSGHGQGIVGLANTRRLGGSNSVPQMFSVDGKSTHLLPADTFMHTVMCNAYEVTHIPRLGYAYGTNYGAWAWQEIMNYNGALTLAESARVQNYLKAKWATP